MVNPSRAADPPGATPSAATSLEAAGFGDCQELKQIHQRIVRALTTATTRCRKFMIARKISALNQALLFYPPRREADGAHPRGPDQYGHRWLAAGRGAAKGGGETSLIMAIMAELSVRAFMRTSSGRLSGRFDGGLRASRGRCEPPSPVALIHAEFPPVPRRPRNRGRHDFSPVLRSKAARPYSILRLVYGKLRRHGNSL